jgi:hypothetical protein
MSSTGESSTRERSDTIPGSGPSPSAEMRRRSSPDLEIRRGEGQAEWHSRTVTREDLLNRYRPGTESRGQPETSTPPSGRSTHVRSNLSEARKETGRSTSSHSSGNGGTAGAPGASRGRTSGTPPDRGDHGRTNTPPSTRDQAGRGSSRGGSGDTRSGGAPSREEFRNLPPVQKERVIVDLPRHDLGRAKQVRNISQAVSDATNLGVHAATASMIAVTTSSCSGWNFWFGWGWGAGCGSCWNSCAGWWWGPYCNWGCYTPCWGWGWGWNWGWNYCWSSYWNYCGYYGWYYPYYGSTYYLAPPPAAYSTIVYETVPYQEEAAPAEPQAVPPGEDVQQPGNAGLTQSVDTASIQREQELNRAADYYLTLGDRAFREGRYGDAVHYYAKAVEFSSEDGILYLILSDALFATGDYHYSAYALRKALELDPGLAKSVVDKHSFYTDPTEFDRQLAILERYLEDHFEDDDARLVLAANYLFGSRPSAAVDLLESSFSKSVATTPAGTCIHDAARAIQSGKPESSEAKQAEKKGEEDGQK